MYKWPKVELPDDKFAIPCCESSSGGGPPIEGGITMLKNCPGFWFESPADGEGILWTVSHPINEDLSGSLDGDDPVLIVFDPDIPNSGSEIVTITAEVYADTSNTDLIGVYQETFSGDQLQCEGDQDSEIRFNHDCPTTEFSVQREGAVFEWDFGWDVYVEQDSDTANPTVAYVQPIPQGGVTVSVNVYQNSDKSDDPEVLTTTIPSDSLQCEGGQ